MRWIDAIEADRSERQQRITTKGTKSTKKRKAKRNGSRDPVRMRRAGKRLQCFHVIFFVSFAPFVVIGFCFCLCLRRREFMQSPG